MLTLKDSEFHSLVGYMKDNFGINLRAKRNLIEGRLNNHLAEKGFSDYQTYLAQVFADPDGSELKNLVNRLTTNHTFFMREPAHFDLLRTAVLPDMEKRLAKKEIRTWSAGCSSGEEPYTLAMLMHDHFGARKLDWDTRILATDISARALERARAGRYPPTVAESVPPAWTKRYFQADGDSLRVADKIKADVVFRSLNLMQESFPFRQKFHIIFCRNVMIYFERETKLELIRRFYELTEPGGWLFIGHAEAIARDETRYAYVQPAVYRKI